MRRLVFGGSFDPVHLGHLAIADAAKKALRPDLLSWVLSRHAPHKEGSPPASAEDRAALLEIALRGRRKEQLDRRELARPGPSYTVDTLEEMRAEDPGGGLAFLAGADTLAHLRTWRSLPRLFELCSWRFAPRPGWGSRELQAFRAALPGELRVTFRATMLEMEEVPYSSTAIRAALAAGGPVEGLPPGVLEELRARGLYAT